MAERLRLYERAVMCPTCKIRFVVTAYWFRYVNVKCPLCEVAFECTKENTVRIT